MLFGLFWLGDVARSQDSDALLPKKPSEDIFGFLGRRHEKQKSYADLPEFDGLSWAEREKKFGFTTNGLEKQLPLIAVQRPFDVYFLEQKSVGSYIDLFGKASSIRDQAEALCSFDLDFERLSTPEELHRALTRLAARAASDECIREDLDADCRFRFHVEIATVNENLRKVGPKFNFETKKFEGKIDKNQPTCTTMVFLCEFINPETHQLMLAMNNPDSLTEEQLKWNGRPIVYEFVTHWIPDSYFDKAVFERVSQIPFHFDDRMTHEVDLNRAVVRSNDYDWVQLKSNEDYQTIEDFLAKLKGKEESETNGILRKYDELAFLVRLEEAEIGDELVWIINPKSITNGFVGEIDNSPQMIKGYRKGQKIEVEFKQIVDVAYLEGLDLKQGKMIEQFQKRLRKSDREKLSRLPRFIVGKDAVHKD